MSFRAIVFTSVGTGFLLRPYIHWNLWGEMDTQTHFGEPRPLVTQQLRSIGSNFKCRAVDFEKHREMKRRESKVPSQPEQQVVIRKRSKGPASLSDFHPR